MGIIWTGLAPHPPIIIETIGGDRCRDVQPTITAMQEMASELVAKKPERLVLISPHTPRPQSGIAAWFSSKLSGNLSQFGAPHVALELPADQDWLKLFTQHFSSITDLGEESLDHGAMVPLHFLYHAGWRGPTVVLGLPWSEDAILDSMGEAVAAACNDHLPTAVLASGDMSHCLKPGAPCGFDERGQHFDNTFINHIKNADYQGASQIDPYLKKVARQDVVESCHITWKASNYQQDNHHFYNYEGPFGVGYAVMRFYGA